MSEERERALSDLSEPATKADLETFKQELKGWMLEREITTLRWMVATFLGAQIAYFAITLSAVWFLLTHH